MPVSLWSRIFRFLAAYVLFFAAFFVFEILLNYWPPHKPLRELVTFPAVISVVLATINQSKVTRRRNLGATPSA